MNRNYIRRNTEVRTVSCFDGTEGENSDLRPLPFLWLTLVQFLPLEASVWPSNLQADQTPACSTFLGDLKAGRQGPGLQMALQGSSAWVQASLGMGPSGNRFVLAHPAQPEAPGGLYLCDDMINVRLFTLPQSPWTQTESTHWGQRAAKVFLFKIRSPAPSAVPGTQKVLINRAHLRTSSNL